MIIVAIVCVNVLDINQVARAIIDVVYAHFL